MTQTRNLFREALVAHDEAALREAFDRVRVSGDRKLHRTTLARWLDGSVPKSEDVVRLMATELRDDNLLTAWHASRGVRSSSPDAVIVSQFERLSPEEQLRAYPEIRRRYLATRFPKLLEGLRYEIVVADPVGDAKDHLIIRLGMEYDAELPAKARVILAATHRRLSDAYEDPSCVFRDRVALPPEELDTLLQAGVDPTLTYNELDRSGQTLISPSGSWVESGIYEFDNEATAKARIRLFFEYPYPRSVQQYPIRFGEFRVSGGAEFTLTLEAASTSGPQAFAFPPAGRHREWAVKATVPNKRLVASIGAGGTILADGDGLVLSWHEAN